MQTPLLGDRAGQLAARPLTPLLADRAGQLPPTGLSTSVRAVPSSRPPTGLPTSVASRPSSQLPGSLYKSAGSAWLTGQPYTSAAAEGIAVKVTPARQTSAGPLPLSARVTQGKASSTASSASIPSEVAKEPSVLLPQIAASLLGGSSETAPQAYAALDSTLQIPPPARLICNLDSPTRPIIPLKEAKENGSPGPQVSDDDPKDPPTMLPWEVDIDRLIAQKHVAVARCDFVLAKILKDRIEMLQTGAPAANDPDLASVRSSNSRAVAKLIKDIQDLEEKQSAAVECEDYAQALECKEKLDRLVSATKAVGRPDLDIVQFTSAMYYVDQLEHFINIDVMRLGSFNGPCRVRWTTKDSSGKAGRQYKAAEGELIFGHNEIRKCIVIQLIDDGYWSTTLEFKVELCEPEECELGLYLHTCRVKVLNDELFPTTKFKQVAAGEKAINSVHILQLWLEFLKLIFHIEGIAWRTVLTILMSQLPNIYLVFQLQVNVYMVDVLFSEETIRNEGDSVAFIFPGLYFSRLTSAALVAFLYIMPMVVCHYWEYRKVKLDIGAMVREFLQGSLIRRYLNYTDESRRAVQPAILQVSMLTDTVQLAVGYEMSVKLAQAVGKTFLLALFILKENERALPACILMPAVMLMFMYKRTTPLTKATERTTDKLALLATVTEETCAKYILIAEYGQRPHAAERFETIGEEVSEAGLDLEIVKTNNEQFPEWLGPVFTGAYIAFAANSVYKGDLKVGVFLATTRVFKELAEAFGHLYNIMVKIAAVFGPLKKITRFLNLETDGQTWKTVNRRRRESTKEARDSMRRESLSGDHKNEMFASDQIELACKNVSFSYESQASKGVDDSVFSNISCTVKQGSLVSVVGTPGNGKSTFLRLLGHQCFPSVGSVFIPTYLRILHVSHDPILLSMSAWENLTFGYPDAEPDFVRLILKRLGMLKTLEEVERNLALLMIEPTKEEQEEEEQEELETSLAAGDWHNKFNFVEKAKIHLARALIVNPEVLILQRPFAHYGQAQTAVLMTCLREHVDNKGLCLPSTPILKTRRRPRTTFFSPSSQYEAEQSDLIWEITPDRHIKSDTVQEVQNRDVF